MNFVYESNYIGLYSCVFYLSYCPNSLYNISRFFSYKTSFSFYSFQNSIINYYVNDPYGITVFDQDWGFIRRLNKSDSVYTFGGDMFIVDDYIYIGSDFVNGGGQLIKTDFDLNIINTISIRKVFCASFSVGYDSCNKRILAMTVDISNNYEIVINVYNLFLRKTSEMNTTSINSNLKSSYPRLHKMYVYWNQIYIYYVDWSSIFTFILVADLDGQYIKTYNLESYSWVNSIVFDQYNNMIFTPNGKVCLFDSFINNVTCSFMADRYFDYLYANIDQSGRFVTIDPVNGKIEVFYNFSSMTTGLNTVKTTSTTTTKIVSSTMIQQTSSGSMFIFFIFLKLALFLTT